MQKVSSCCGDRVIPVQDVLESTGYNSCGKCTKACDAVDNDLTMVKLSLQEKKLYLVRSINQSTGQHITQYYLAENIGHIESALADIISIKTLINFEDLTLEE